jgi:tetratricopeptide (TPR) repeat protein/cytochrome c553
MLTTLIIVLLGLALFAYVALPLVNPRGADPLPSEKDPVTSDLEEEKEALFRAIRELDGRADLAPERREQLRARYEAKAARVLRALDERSALRTAERPGKRPVAGARRTRVPYGTLTLLAGTVVIATTLGSFVLPRVGESASLTSFFSEDLDLARALRDARRAAERDPSANNLLALADAYWRVDDADNAQATYLRAVEEAGARSAVAFRRLGFLSLQTDLEQALEYLESARRLEPNDLDTLYALGEINFVLGDLDAATAAWREFLRAPGGQDDPLVLSRLELVAEMAPLAERVEADPSRENLLALADAFWRFDERQRAVELYFRVLTQLDPNDPVALGRTGQLMFLSGRNEDAIALMERAALSDRVGADTLLFLGNAYYSAERYRDAIEAWERHIEIVGAERAGRVPGLIEDARARLAGAEPGEEAAGPETLAEAGDGAVNPEPAGAASGAMSERASDSGNDGAGEGATGAAPNGGEATGAALFAANCASCHGDEGSGGIGPRLAGNRRATDAGNVANAVRFGRGIMPGFAAALDADQIDRLVSYVTEVLNASGARP